MEFWKEYLMHILSASMICGALTRMVPDKSDFGKLVRLLCNIFLIISVISPIKDFEMGDISQYIQDFDIRTDATVNAGQEFANNQTGLIIKENTEAYILDKASAMGLAIDVEVTIGEESPQVPISVLITGTAAPASKKQLQDWIAGELNIDREHQLWR